MKMLTRLALNNNKKNKARSILDQAVIFLSTTLLSSIALICYGAQNTSKGQCEGIIRNFLRSL